MTKKTFNVFGKQKTLTRNGAIFIKSIQAQKAIELMAKKISDVYTNIEDTEPDFAVVYDTEIEAYEYQVKYLSEVFEVTEDFLLKQDPFNIRQLYTDVFVWASTREDQAELGENLAKKQQQLMKN